MEVSTNLGVQKSADPPYTLLGLRQPLIYYGEVCTHGATPMYIRSCSINSFEVAVQQSD